MLDVGCGPGNDTLSLAGLVGPTGLVCGVDVDATMLALANQAAQEQGIAWVRHDYASVPPLPYDDGAFDAVRSERVFQHLTESDAVLDEMVRVTKEGGRLLVADSDHSSLSFDVGPELADVEWRLRRFRTEFFANGYSGRRLANLFRARGLEDIEIELLPFWTSDYALGRCFGLMSVVEQRAVETGVVSADELARLDETCREGSRNGRFFGYSVMIVVAGTKPGPKERTAG